MDSHREEDDLSHIAREVVGKSATDGLPASVPNQGFVSWVPTIWYFGTFHLSANQLASRPADQPNVTPSDSTGGGIDLSFFDIAVLNKNRKARLAPPFGSKASFRPQSGHEGLLIERLGGHCWGHVGPLAVGTDES
jgi:hypothetical protein